MKTLSLIILLAFFSSCATPGGEYCDPAKFGFIKGLRCSGDGYENYVKDKEKNLEQEKVKRAELRADSQQLTKIKKEKEKELADLENQLNTLNREIQLLYDEIEHLGEMHARSIELSAQIRKRLQKISTALMVLAQTYDTASYKLGPDKGHYRAANQLSAAAEDARKSAYRFQGFARDALTAVILDLIPMKTTLKIILDIGLAYCNNYHRS